MEKKTQFQYIEQNMSVHNTANGSLKEGNTDVTQQLFTKYNKINCPAQDCRLPSSSRGITVRRLLVSLWSQEWHLRAPIPYTKSLHFTIQKLSEMTAKLICRYHLRILNHTSKSALPNKIEKERPRPSLLGFTLWVRNYFVSLGSRVINIC